MPVLDHEVHPSVRMADGQKPGCFNRGPFSPGYWAPDRRYLDDGTWIETQTFIPHRMSETCRYDQAIAPERCEGCRHHGAGLEYVRSVEEKGR